MQEPTLRDVFSASWKLTIRHRALWILGLFAMIFGQLGIIDVLTGIVKGTSQQATLGFTRQLLYVFSPSTLAQIGNTLNYSFDSWGALALLLVIIFGLAATLLVVASISQGALVHAASLSMEHGLRSVEKFDESWHAGARKASPILLLNILKKCILFALSLIVASAAFGALVYGSVFSILVFIIAFISAIILGMTVSNWTIFAIGYLVIEEKDLFDSIRMGWKLLMKHWIVACEVGIILIIINVLVFLALLAGIYVLVTPSLAINAYGALIGSTAIAQFGTSMAIVLFLSYAAILGSIFTVFVTSAWTYLFAIMHHWGFKSRIHAVVTSFKRS